MHRIDGRGHIGNRFTNGNYATGQMATAVGADWLNDLQENVMAVIDAGDVEAEKGRALDLLDSIDNRIRALIGLLSPDAPEGVPPTRTLNGLGLVQPIGNLTQNRNVQVKRATAASVAAGTVDDEAVTPLALAQSFSTNLAADGGADLPGGLAFRWGGERADYSEGSHYVAFDTPFDTACFRVVLTGVNTDSLNNRDTWPQLVSSNREGFTFYSQWTGVAGTNRFLRGIDYFAVGR